METSTSLALFLSLQVIVVIMLLLYSQRPSGPNSSEFDRFIDADTSTICITAATGDYVPMIQNLSMFWKKNTTVQLCVIALDTEAAVKLRRMGIDHVFLNQPNHSMENGSTGIVGYKDSREAYVRLMFKKLDLIRRVFAATSPSKLDRVFWVDGDCVLLRDVRILLDDSPPNLDCIFQCNVSNELFPKVKDSVTAACPKDHPICAGLMLVRRTQAMLDVLDYRKHISPTLLNDPRKLAATYPYGDETYLTTQLPKINYSLMNPTLVETGIYPSNNSIHKDAVIVHYSWWSGKEKMRSMQKHGHWIISEPLT
jgi:hypothetical protein